MLNELKADLKALADPEKAAFYPTFFKAGKGQYAEGDQFLGITVPNQRKVAKKYKAIGLSDLEKLLNSKFHEHRLTALYILVLQYEKRSEEEKEAIYEFYLEQKKQINNWDLVDTSAPKIVGVHLLNRDRSVLYKLVKSKSLWDRRIAMLATFTFIRESDFEDALKIADMLVGDSHDLIHKAVGWMLREIGKRDLKVEEQFLDRHYKTMPRTMLRYAIEKFSPAKKKHYMGK